MSNKPRRHSSSYPVEFMQLFRYVLEMGESISVDNLGPSRGAYTSLRARLNAWRKIFHDEAVEARDEDKLQIAKDLYTINLQVRDDPKPHLLVSLHEQEVAAKLAELLANAPEGAPPKMDDIFGGD